MLPRALLCGFLFLAISPQTQPRLLLHVESLSYPSIARFAQITGDVVLIAQVDPNGRVSAVVGKSGGPPLMAAARDNLKTWRFQAGEYQEMEITYHFKLEGMPVSYDGPTECAFDLPDSVTVVAAPQSVEFSDSSHQKSGRQ